MNRPFFSVIIPCYNSKPERIKELFDSIINAGCPNITEVIISDDRSTDKSYLNIVEEYRDKLYDIIITEVPNINDNDIKLINCPSNTRENGVKKATGEWITFADHDDIFAENALLKIKDVIDKTGENRIVFSSFKSFNTETKEIKILQDDASYNWMHGKFYNLDNFWKKYDFHFRTNFKSHEDVAISTKVRCITARIMDKILYPDIVTYIWRKWPDSVSHMRSNNGNDYTKYIYDFFLDFIESTIKIYVEDYNQLSEKGELTEKIINFNKGTQADIILFMYFYIQAFKYNYKYDFNPDYESAVKKQIRVFYKLFDSDPSDLYNFIRVNNRDEYEDWFGRVRDYVLDTLGYFVEIDSFYDFISK